MADIWHYPPPTPASVAPLSRHAQIHMHALQPSLPLFPLASPSCLLLWPDEPPLFICYYTGIVRSKTQREPACVPALLAAGPPASRPFIRALAVYRSAAPGCEEPAHAVCLRGRRVRTSPQLTFRLPPSGLALCLPPSLQPASEGL